MYSAIKQSAEYHLIKEFYGDKTSSRSKVPLINHINEGIVVLEDMEAGYHTATAFCIHPLLQADEDLAANLDKVLTVASGRAVALALEYRSVANEYLSPKVTPVDEIRLSPLKAVNDMLIADKVQNRKDFYTYHWSTHPRAKELETYFKEWLAVLGVEVDDYIYFCAAIDENKHHESEIAQLRNKVNTYEDILHKIQMNADVVMNPGKVEKLIKGICDWSYAHRSGNGELSEQEQDERIALALNTLKFLR
jgi:hypothetical protein